ncbi:hypothetical protein F2Q69_00032506 [Brassica cretica]|uniref:UspA domain-containing protein n=1 Tax=Brassica cretica TaxID=69181 RepID=A0A8S9RVH6_BRACR|nr:hypothetical protein F2Q69_00032506 [Brassica cretica]
MELTVEDLRSSVANPLEKFISLFTFKCIIKNFWIFFRYIEVEIRRLEGKEKEKGEKIVEEAKEQQVTFLVVGEEKKPPVWRLVKRWGWKKRCSRAGVLKYCLEKASCMTIAVKPENRKLGGYLITTKRHKNFWLFA